MERVHQIWGPSVIALCGAALLRLVGLGASLDTTEVRWFPIPPLAAVGNEPANASVLPHLFGPLWSYTLSEGAVRLPGALAALASLVLCVVLLRFLGARMATVAAAWVVALWPLHIRSARFLDPAPFVLLGGILALAFGLSAARCSTKRASILALLVALVLLAATLWGSIGGWWVWASVAAAMGTQAKTFRRHALILWGLGGVCLAGWQAWLGLPAPSFFFLRLDLQNWSGWWEKLPQPLGIVAWLFVLAGAVASTREPQWRWLVAGALTALGLLLTASIERWHLDLSTQLLVALPAILLVARGIEAVGAWGAGAGWRLALWAAVTLAGVGGALLPAAWSEFQRPRPNWKLVARTLLDLRQPDAVLAPSLCRRVLVFYEPELAFWAQTDAPPANALAYFPSARSGWLVVAPAARLYPGFDQVARWVERFRAVDVSPDPAVNVFRYERSGPDLALRHLAYQRLPSASLARNGLLAELLRASGAAPPALWKVDQLILNPPPQFEPEVRLLYAVALLSENKHLDRAASLAVFLASRFPNWREAQVLGDWFRSRPRDR